MKELVETSTTEQRNLLAAQQEDLAAALSELNGGNAVKAHKENLQRHASAMAVASADAQAQLTTQHDGLNAVIAKVVADHGEKSGVAQCETQREALNDGLAASLQQLQTHQSEMTDTASKLKGTLLGDKVDVLATLKETSEHLEKGRKEHTQALSVQASALDAHAEKLKTTLQEQTTAQEVMQARVMAGVAALLSEGMAGLTNQLTQAVQELSAENADLKAKNTELSSQVQDFTSSAQELVDSRCQAQVKQWGSAIESIKSQVELTCESSVELSLKVTALGKDQNSKSDGLVKHVQAWGSSNREVTKLVGVEVEASATINEAVGTLDSEAQVTIGVWRRKSFFFFVPKRKLSIFVIFAHRRFYIVLIFVIFALTPEPTLSRYLFSGCCGLSQH
jgi:hypothetical protein